MINAITERIFSDTQEEFTSIEVDDELAEIMENPPKPYGALRVRPFKKHKGIERGVSFLKSMYDDDEMNHNAFEMAYGDKDLAEDESATKTLDFKFVSQEPEELEWMQAQLFDKYPNAQVERDTPQFLSVSNEEDEGKKHLSACELVSKKYTLNLIQNIDLDGFERDPFGSITSSMVDSSSLTEEDSDIVVQTMFKPAESDWVEGVNGGKSIDQLANELDSPTYRRERKLITKTTVEDPPSPKEKEAANVLRNMRYKRGWRLCIRVFALSTDPDVAIKRAKQAAQQYQNYYESNTGQSIVPAPLKKSKIRERAIDAANRDYSGTEIVKNEKEAAGLVHVPNDDINTQNIDWALAKAGSAVPPGTPRFDYEAHGVPKVSTTREEREEEMFRDSEKGQPIWLGTGAREGTEAGVREETLNTHMFVGGASGKGKSTLLKNFFRQVATRDHGAMFYDPKGLDAEDFAAIVPEEREDDLIYMEIGGDRDKQVAFNFLEVPTNAEPNTPEFEQAADTLTDDITALLAMAGGEQDFWGPKMDSIARNLIHGMARSGHKCTLLDMYFALLSEDQRGAYADMLEQERVDWIVNFAQEQLSEMSDDEVRPVLRRLQRWVESGLMRELVSYPESTVSIEDAIADGKIIIVQDKSTSDDAGTMVATALIRRIWVAVREQKMNDEMEDPPKFYAILDEFNDIVSKQSNIANILSEARSFGLSITAATQDLSAQLDDEIHSAIEGQCSTFLSFNPGRTGDARIIANQHSKDLDKDDLLNLSKYRFYMRTHNDREELTNSYKVIGFPPIDEVADFARNEEEKEALIENSLDRYGTERRTSRQIKAESTFYNGDDMDLELSGDTHADNNERVLTTKAIYDETIRSSEATVGEWIDPNRCKERLTRYTSEDVNHTSQLWDMLEVVPDDWVERKEIDGEMKVRVTGIGETEIFKSGGAATSGGGKHRELLKDTYKRLTELGLEMQIEQQSGGADVDGKGLIRESFEVNTENKSLSEIAQMADELQEQYPKLFRLTNGGDVTIEAESSTGRSKPAQTLQNLVKAQERGEKCLFTVREDTAMDVWRTLTDPPMMRSEDTFYNAGKLTTEEDKRPVRPNNGNAIWRRDGDEIVFEDTTGEEHARFGEPAEVWSRIDKYPSTKSRTSSDKWTEVNEPFIPEAKFENVPDEDAWEIVVVPSDSSESVSLVEDGEIIPLSEAIDESDSQSVEESLSNLGI